MAFLVSTTGTLNPVVINDLAGRQFEHPTVDFDLSLINTPEEIAESDDLQYAIDQGYITVANENGDPITEINGSEGGEEGTEPWDHTHVIFADDKNGFVPAPITEDNKFLRDDGTWQVISASGSDFGTEYNYEESLGQSSTTSESYQQKLRLTVSDLPAGKYRICWYYEWKFSNGNFEFEHRIQVDDSLTLKETDTTPRSVGDWQGSSGFASDIDLTSGSHYIDMDYNTSQSGKTAYIRMARLEIWRIS